MTDDKHVGCIEGCKIKTASGHYIDLEKPDPSHIDIHSIAQSISRICRFGGHTRRFYSVAEHCCCCEILAEEERLSTSIRRSILMHDAAEAYLGDLVRPLKRLVGDVYERLELAFDRAIERRFDVDLTSEATRWFIKRFDYIVLKQEKRFFWPDDNSEWSGLGEVEDKRVAINCYSPRQAESLFKESAALLDIE